MPRVVTITRTVTILLFFITLAPTARAEVWGDGRDRWTLLPRKLLNRDLFAQLAALDQKTRLGRDLDMVTAAADTTVSGQIPVTDDERSRFHGYFVLDAFMALRPLAGLDINLNVTLLNPSASDGYRVSSEVLPGLALHFYRDLWTFGGEPLRFDLLVFDLDLTTVGHGLLLEEVPLEGYAGGLRWGSFRLEAIFAGRVFWFNDDFWSYTLSALDGAVKMWWATWLQGGAFERITGDTLVFNGADLDTRTFSEGAHFLGLLGSFVPHPAVRLAAEISLRARRHPKVAALVRLDYLDQELSFLALHAGYQLRFYQQGFGPGRQLGGQTTVPNLPDREDAYVTNSFEYLAISHYYDQWSHTVMAEVRAEILPGLALTAEGEYWLRVVSDPRQRKRLVFLPRGGRVPGVVHDIFYRLGVEIRPWLHLPHRLRGLFTNKVVEAGLSAVDVEARRFSHVPLFVFEVEVRL